MPCLHISIRLHHANRGTVAQQSRQGIYRQSKLKISRNRDDLTTCSVVVMNLGKLRLHFRAENGERGSEENKLKTHINVYTWI